MKFSIIKIAAFSLIAVFLYGSCTSKNTPPNILKPYQSLKTHAARSVTPFTINGTLYLGVPQFSQDMPSGVNNGPDGGNQDTESVIYRWENGEFKEFQKIQSHGARDFEFFSINGDSFIALANLRGGVEPNFDPNVSSVIYKWDGSKFVEFQKFQTDGAQEWRYFEIQNRHFLAIANFAKTTEQGVNVNINSNIYEWKNDKFELFQAIPTSGAFDWGFTELGGEYYLAAANNTGNSEIFKWTGEKFESFQKIPTSGGRNIIFFDLDGSRYMAVSVLKDVSQVFKWDGEKFAPFQFINSLGGRRFVFYKGKKNYLIKLNYFLQAHGTHQIAGEIYYWNNKKFWKLQDFEAHGGSDGAIFEKDGKVFFAVSNAHASETSFSVDSEIYLFDEKEVFGND